MEAKICIAGIGGVGGFIGGALAKRYPHVSFFVRGSRKEAIEQNGLVIKSEYMGDYRVKPERMSDKADDLGIMDYIFICVKNYSLEQLCRQIAPMVDEKTVVIPVMNGIDPAERTRNCLGKGIVLDALIYIASGSQEDYTIVQAGKYASVHIGMKKPSEGEEEALVRVNDILNNSGVKCIVEDDIEAVIWKKYVLNCAFNILTAYYSANTGELRNDPKKVEEFRSLLSEACLAARKKGVHLTDDVEEDHLYHFLHRQSDNATSSLRRDMDLKKANELETFSGYLLKLGNQLGLELPVTKYFYDRLKARY